jgi:hypothetical protein
VPLKFRVSPAGAVILMAANFLSSPVLRTTICRAVLSRSGTAVELSYDHKPSRADERERIIKAGGTVITNRLYGVLGVSRSFGDLRFKSAVVRDASKALLLLRAYRRFSSAIWR